LKPGGFHGSVFWVFLKMSIHEFFAEFEILYSRACQGSRNQGAKRSSEKQHENTEMVEQYTLKDRIKSLWNNVKNLQGEPRHMATGMAIGVFIGMTPIIPFHTITAVALAFIFKGSKPAAAIGVWIANPITIPFLYVGSFKAGTLLLNKPIPLDAGFESIQDLLSLGIDATIAMVTGGALLGILPGIIAYIVTYKFFRAVRSAALQKKLQHE
jgi:uncharacterized protein (DUF2062 family)